MFDFYKAGNFVDKLENYQSQGSSVGIANGYRLDNSGSGVRFPGGGLGMFLFSTASRPTMGPIQPPIQWVLGGGGALSPGIKWSGREADHSSPSSVEDKTAWSYTSTQQYIFMTWCLVKHRDKFTFFTFYFTFNWKTCTMKLIEISVSNVR
jgi:hypothetical protein